MTTTYSNFVLPTAIHSGSQTRGMIPELFRGLGAKRVVLISDQGLKDAGIVQKVAEIFARTLHGAGPQLVGIFTDINQDAGSESVNKATQFARERAADGLLAVGGGSVIDAVKGVKFALHYGALDIKEKMPSGNNFFYWPEAKKMSIPHITVPTTAGTGSEVSPIAVIYNEATKIKTSIIHPYISSDIAILDPDLTVGLPPFTTAFTGFDALTHAIEALVSPNATAFTEAYALQTIRMIVGALPEVIKDGSNLQARMEMLQASAMGITAFSISLSAIPIHNLAHAYGALFRIPHGLANAVFLPIVMEELPHFYLPKVNLLAEALGLDNRDKSDEELLKNSIGKIVQLQKDVGLPSDFSNYDLGSVSKDSVIQAVKEDPSGKAFTLPTDLVTKISNRVINLT